ncbi:MAG TPA: permease-like cell division protein FtsX [Gammaproteobacteria bacterium]|nr:permease-like cell division protein FtsX [Gammaproteobacteria bacterium]
MKTPGKNRRHSSHHWRDNLRRLLSPRTFLQRHAQVALESLGRLYRNGVASLMTAAVIGIALAMPSGLFLLLDNLNRLSGAWEGQVSLSVFLRQDIDSDTARHLADKLATWPEIGAVQLVTPQQALQEFSEHSGFADVLGLLADNPLPAVLIVTPAEDQTDPALAGALQARLSALPETDLAQLDLEWVQRLAAILEIARRGIVLISALLALAVLLVIGNTIRLEIQNRREEILVTKLIGATNAFVRRPFLYSGTWYGIFGALLAWGLVETGFNLLSEPVGKLMGLYQTDFALETLPLTLFGLLALSGVILGLLGSWLAVGRHLHAIEPS